MGVVFIRKEKDGRVFSQPKVSVWHIIPLCPSEQMTLMATVLLFSEYLLQTSAQNAPVDKVSNN